MEMTLEDLNLFPHYNGFQHREYFPNGYGLSVIPELDGEHYELAVVEHVDGAKAHLTYSTPLTQDVLRYCTREAIWSLRDRIRNLPPRTVSVVPERQGGKTFSQKEG
jgi:hypothetical protein